MATKLQVIRGLADKTASDLTTLRGNWQRYLETSARLYKYSFPDQMLIYAQKPDAIAVAEIELWNDKFDRWVRRGTKGIALIDDTGHYPRLRHVFDINDTEPSRYNARPVQLWEMRQEHKGNILAALANNYEDVDETDSLTDAFRSIANQLAREYYNDNAHDILYRAENSVLEPQALYDMDGAAYDERDNTYLEGTFVEMLTNSIAYTLMSRCGLDVEDEFEDEDFQAIADFNTTDIIYALGTAVSELSEQVLRDVEIVIKKYERAQAAERSEQNYDRNPYLQPSGRLSASESQAVGIAGGTNAVGQIRADEESVPQRTQDNQLQPPAPDREAVSASAGSGRGGEPQARIPDESVDGADEPARQIDRPNGVDESDEHAEIPSGRNGDARTDLRIDADETPSDEGGVLVSIVELLSTSPITLDEVDSILRDGGNFDNHRLSLMPFESRSAMRIAAHFTKGLDDNVWFLKKEFLTGIYGRDYSESGKGFDFGNHRVCAWFTAEGIELAIGVTAKNNIHKVVIPWEAAAERIDELMREGRYISGAAYDNALENERLELADKLWSFYRDDMGGVPDEWRGESGGHPADIAKIKSLLDDENERQIIRDRLEADVNAWLDNPESRSWHSPLRVLDEMNAAMHPPIMTPYNDFTNTKNFSHFITQDEIDALLTRGGTYSEGKFRFMSFFLNDHDEKERIDFVKREYGHGGGTWSQTDGWQNAEPGKGLTLQRGGSIGKPDTEVNLKWNAVSRRIDDLIKRGQFFTQSELDSVPSYEKLMLARSINSFYYDLPEEEYLRPFAKELDFHYPHEDEWNALNDFLNDPERIESTLGQMRYIFENTPDNDRYYNTRKIGYERLTAFRDGTYTLFPGIENLPPPGTPVFTPVAAASRSREVIDLSDNRDFGKPPEPATQMTLFDSMPPLPSVKEQKIKINENLKQEAAEIKAASDILENDTDAFLLNISNEDKARLYEQFADNPRSRAAVNLVKEIYGGTLPIPLPQAIKRLQELAELGRLDGIGDPYNLFDLVRDALLERGYVVSGEIVEDGINEFRERVGSGEFADVADFIESEYLTEEPEAQRRAIPGDTFYYQNKPFVIDTIDDMGVMLIDPSIAVPVKAHLFRREFDELIATDGRNAHYLPFASETQAPEREATTDSEPEPPAPSDSLESDSTAPEPPDFETLKQTVYDCIMADEFYAYHLQFADSRGALRSPLNTALDKIIAALRPGVPDGFFNDDITDELFNFVYRESWANRPLPEAEQKTERDAEQEPQEPESAFGTFTEITDPAEIAEIEAIFGSQPQAEPIAVIDNVSRNNFNLFSLAFPRIIDGTYQSMTFKDENNREMSVSYATTNADIINLDIAFYKPDGHRGFAPMFQFRVNHEQRMLTPISYANDETGEDVGLLTLANDEQIAGLGVKAYEFISGINKLGFSLEKADVFLDADGNPLPAEPKTDITAFLKERADRESDAWGRVQQSMFAPVESEQPQAEPEQPRYGVRPTVIVEQISSNPRRVNLLDKGDTGRRYSIYDNHAERFLKTDDERYVTFRTEREAQDYADKLNSGEIRFPPAKLAPNFRITDDHLGEGGAKAKYRNNIEAIRIIKDIERRGSNADADEQEKLSRYVGWGGLPQAFDENNKDWADEYAELQSLLTPEEYDMARASTLNAHYTTPVVIKAMWETIERLGFKSGNILEPSMGIGNFFGLIPGDMWQSKLYGVELDSMTAQIAKQLYPHANIQQIGFEKTDFSDAFFDLAIGNVPFGNYGVADNRYKQNFSIHDYFFQKSIDKVRPGGVVAFITSKFTMDSKNPEVRKYIAQRAELLGAVRLPNDAFLKNAGTETTMDILFLQKRDRPLDIEPDWIHLGKTEDGIPCNRYFIDNPEMVCGKMGLFERMNNKFGRDDYTCCLPIEGADLGEQLRAALLNVQGTYTVTELDDLDGVDNHAIPADPLVKNFSYALVTPTTEPDNVDGRIYAAKVGEGQVYFRENSLMYPVDLPATTLERIKGMIGLRDCVQELIALQLDDYGENEIRAKQMELSDLYDGFIAEYGLINSTANNRAFNADSAYYLLCSLEILDEDGNLQRKADMFTKRTIKQKTVITHVDTPSEALAVSIGERARVDLAYMSELTGMSEEALAEELQGVIFLNIGSADSQEKVYVTADEYLSGNIRKKLEYAEAAAMTVPSLQVNVEALRAVMPKDLEAGEISVRLGSTWIDPEYVQEFMYELLNTNWRAQNIYQVKYHQYTGEWQVTGKGKSQFSDIPATVTYGTGRMNAYQIIDDTLNLRDVRVYDYKEDADGKERRVLNKKETMLAQQKQELIKQKFKDWIWNEPERRQTLVQKYNEMFNSVRTREYDGSHITFGGISPEIELKPHQLNAIAHILYGGNTLLAHVVGAGKTFEMVAAAMESKRLGLCNKSLFAVPNHLTEQWASEFLRLYPSANILVATKKDFEMRNRKKFCAKIATGDYDAVIIGHTQLEKIPMSRERQERLLNEQLWEIEQGIKELKASNGERYSIKGLEKTKRSLEARLAKLLDSKKRDDVVTFEQLGVDRLYVDEAHNFKNLFLYTKMRNVAGLSTSEAQKSSDLFMKCRYMDELTNNKGVIFATGTPISNSMTEMYTMQRYLQYDTLAAKNLTHFDAWASIFGETTTSIELAPEGTGYRARTRFAQFHNLPELMSMFKDVADIQTADMLNLPVPEATFENVIVEPSELQKEMVQELSERAAAVHNREVDASVDNMLKITTDGRKIGLDQRLMNPLLPDFEGSKINACTENVFRIWNETKNDRLTQLVFSDFSTPNKDGRFNIYDDIRAKLIERGIPEHEIVFIHEADTETKKKELFAKVRQGKVRVLLGSTFKMGAGTNVQDRLVASHDVDCPWRPADLEQRSGRIIRQGNMNPEVKIFRYATTGTFDSYLWQTVQKKQEFIAQIMSSKSPVRSCEDVDETAVRPDRA